MDKKNKIFFLVLFLLIAGSVAMTYWRIMIRKDYVIEAQTDCDPTVDECFIWECDPQSSVEGEACTGDPEEDIWYFQVIRRNAKNIPLCNPDEDENCEALVCGENEADCEYEFCSEEAMEEQYASACNDPVEYLLNNPEEDEEGDEEEDLSADEAAECEERDEECITQEKVECEEGDEECITQEENSNEDGACEAGDETCQDESASNNIEKEEVKSDEIES